MRRVFSIVLILALSATAFSQFRIQQRSQGLTQRAAAPQTTQVNHVFWIWFENEENVAINAATAPTFANFASTYANLTNFSGVSHPSQPNYLDAFSGSNQAI